MPLDEDTRPTALARLTILMDDRARASVLMETAEDLVDRLRGASDLDAVIMFALALHAMGVQDSASFAARVRGARMLIDLHAALPVPVLEVLEAPPEVKL